MNEYIKINPIGGGAFIPSTEKGAANGVATLDGSSKIPVAQLPNSVMEYKGAWDAFTNSPFLADGVGNNGDTYRVSVAGTQNLGSGPLTFALGDFAIYNGAIWQRSPSGITGATTTLNNLAAVAINTSLVSDTNNTDDLGTNSIGWKDLYLEGSIKDGSVVVITPLASGCQIRGTNTSDNAATGFVGEYVESVVSSWTNFPASGSFGDFTSITLTAGDWDITGTVEINRNGATFTSVQLYTGISYDPGNAFSDAVQGENFFIDDATLPLTFNFLYRDIPCYRRSFVNASIVYYFKAFAATYTSGNPQYKCRFSARRVR